MLWFTAARGRRNWRRVSHDKHTYCLEGDPHSGRAPVSICTTAIGGGLTVVARHPAGAGSGRRIAGHPDTTVTQAALPKHLQKLVNALS
jgi:hypothetical protein